MTAPRDPGQTAGNGNEKGKGREDVQTDPEKEK